MKIDTLELSTTKEDFWLDKSKAYDILKQIKDDNDKINYIKNIDKEYELLMFHLEVINQDIVVPEESIEHLDNFIEVMNELYRLTSASFVSF